MKFGKICFFIFSLFLLFFLTTKNSFATNYYVAGDTGLDTNDGTIGSPWQTIQKAANTLLPGDTVNVKGGLTYSGSNTCGLGTASVCLSITGTAGNYITYRSWPGTGVATISGPTTGVGIGVWSNTATVLSYIKINGFIIKDAKFGVYLRFGSENIITNNVIYNSTPITNGYGIYIGSSSFTHSVYIYNNTIYGTYNGIYLLSGTDNIKNNIISDCVKYGILINMWNTTEPTINNNNVYGCQTKNYAVGTYPLGNTNYSSDPKFSDAVNFDFTLKSDSPIINLGATLSEASTDIIGTARPQEGSYDIGAYETNFAPTTSATPYSQSTIVNQLGLLATYSARNQADYFVNNNSYPSLAVGDVTGDGLADVIVGARRYTTVDTMGRVYIFKGKQNLTDVTAENAEIIISNTTQNGDGLGETVGVGDINNDGNNDLFVSTHQHGSLHIFKGGSTLTSTEIASSNALVTFSSGPVSFASPTEAVGDVNGDGISDYVVAGRLSQQEVYLFYGSTQFESKSTSQAIATFTNSNTWGQISIGSADLNRDGYSDILLGNLFDSKVYVFYGGPTLVGNIDISHANFVIDGSGSGSFFGSRQRIVAKDFNQDGYVDIAAASQTNIYIFFGTASSWGNLDTSQANVVYTYDPNFPETPSLGGGLSSADINNDGYPDIIIASTSLSRTYVMFSGANMISKDVSNADLVGQTTWNYTGGEVLTSGDLNGDGYQEIAISGYANPSGNEVLGGVYILAPPHGTPSITTNSIGNTNSLSVSGSFSDSQTTNGIEVSADGSNWIGCAISGSKFTCTLPSSLSDGNHSLRLRSKNIHGVYMATKEYSSISFTYDHTSPLVDWVDNLSNKKKYESSGEDNVYTTELYPTFTFSKSNDAITGISKYQILINDSVYIDDIEPNKPADKEYKEDDDKYVKYDNDYISVRSKKAKLLNKAYKWKVRVIDNAGNVTDTKNKILRVNTYEANFSNTFFPLTILNIGGIKTDISNLHYYSNPNNVNISNFYPAFYGIAPVNTKIYLKIGDDYYQTVANRDSRFGININKSIQNSVKVKIYAVNGNGDYVEIPEFNLNVNRYSLKTNIQGATTSKQIVENNIVDKIVNKPPLSAEIPKKRCVLWFCF